MVLGLVIKIEHSLYLATQNRKVIKMLNIILVLLYILFFILMFFNYKYQKAQVELLEQNKKTLELNIKILELNIKKIELLEKRIKELKWEY